MLGVLTSEHREQISAPSIHTVQSFCHVVSTQLIGLLTKLCAPPPPPPKTKTPNKQTKTKQKPTTNNKNQPLNQTKPNTPPPPPKKKKKKMNNFPTNQPYRQTFARQGLLAIDVRRRTICPFSWTSWMHHYLPVILLFVNEPRLSWNRMNWSHTLLLSFSG